MIPPPDNYPRGLPQEMAHLALNGGTKVRESGFTRWPIFGDAERKAMVGVVDSGGWGGVEQRLRPQFEEQFAAFQQSKYCVSVTSGTTALDIAIRALGISFGDEVILSPYTFIASATAVLMNNAIPVFVDMDPDTYLIDPEKIEAAITPRTKAIMAIHIAGMPCDMDQIMQIAARHDLYVIEDAAQAHGAEWNGQRVGAIGHVGCFSFQSSKNLTAGEGGAIVTNDQEIFDRCWSIHNVGRIPGGRWYEHRNLGANYRMTEWQAAILLAQMTKLPEQMQRREANATYLAEKLDEVPGVQAALRPRKVTSHAWHLFIMRYDETQFGGAPREKFLKALQAEGIPCSAGYVPLYREELFTRMRTDDCPMTCKHVERAIDYNLVSCPVCEKACASECVWFSQSMFLGERSDMDSIVEAVAKIQKHNTELADR